MGDNGFWQTTTLDGLINNNAVILMQYTGLKDENGVEIYEGDVIEANTFDLESNIKLKGKILFNEERFAFAFYPEEYVNSYPIYSIIECEIIGNIYEHPHLLKGE